MAVPSNQRKTMRSLIGVFLILMMAVSFGCASVKKGTTTAAETTDKYTAMAVSPFVSSTRLNMGPFAEQMVQFIGDVQFGMAGGKIVYTRPYLNGPKTEEYTEMMTQFRRNMGRILAYTGRVVSLAQSNLDGPGRAQALASFIEVIQPKEKDNSDFPFKYSPEEIDAIIASVGQQQTLLDALAVAQPLVVESARYLRDRVDEIKDFRKLVEDEIEANILAEYEDMLNFAALLKERQELNYQRLTIFVRYFDTRDPDLLAALAEDKELKGIIGKKKKLDTGTREKVVTALLKRLELINQHKEFLSADLDLFRKIQRELDALVDQSDATLQRAKVAIIFWSQAHSRLAAGETSPAMFDFMGLTKSALGQVQQ